MTTNNTRKIVTLLAVLIIGATMSGCIESVVSDINIDTITIPVSAPTYITESVDITTDPTMKTVVNVTNESVIEPIQKHITITAMQESDSLIITVQGGKDLHQLRELRVLVNNETMDVYSPDCQVPRTIGCTIIGDWKVVCEATYEDGTVQTILSTRFGGLPNPKTETTIAPERYIEPSTTSREEAKRICEENGVIWDCDDPVVAPTAVPTPAPTPIVTPTVEPTPTVTPTASTTKPIEVWKTGSYIKSNWKVSIHIANWLGDNKILFGTASTRYGGWRPEDSLDQLKLIKIHVDDQLVATITPDVIDNPNGGWQIMNNTCIIELPDGLTNSGEITASGTFVDLIPCDECEDLLDGEYRMHTSIRLADDRYYDYPIYQG